MTSTVTHRRDTVAMIGRTATVVRPYTTRSYAVTVANRCDVPNPYARAGGHARGKILRTMGTVATVCDGNPEKHAVRPRTQPVCTRLPQAGCRWARATTAGARMTRFNNHTEIMR